MTEKLCEWKIPAVRRVENFFDLTFLFPLHGGEGKKTVSKSPGHYGEGNKRGEVRITVSSGVLLRCLIHKTKCGNSNTTLRVPGRILKVSHFQERPKFAARSGSQRSISGSQSEMWRVLTRTGAFHPTDSAEIRTLLDRIF